MPEIMTAREAVERYIKTGTQICWGGFSYTRRPFTIAREVIRQRDRIQHTFCTMNGGASVEEALAANDLISRMETTYVGLEGIQPVANSIRRRWECRYRFSLFLWWSHAARRGHTGVQARQHIRCYCLLLLRRLLDGPRSCAFAWDRHPCCTWRGKGT